MIQILWRIARGKVDWDDESEDADVDDIIMPVIDAECIWKEDNGAWWKLEPSDAEATS